MQDLARQALADHGVDITRLHPSVRCALDAALLAASAQLRSLLTSGRLLATSPRSAALLSQQGVVPACVAEAVAAVRAGATTLKLKV